MVSKLINDVKYFFERLFDREGKPLLMLSIIGVVLAVLEAIVFIITIRKDNQLNIPFIIFYTYILYFINRFLIRAIQSLLIRFNISKYQEDNFNYSENDVNNKIRRYNSSVYIKERDRFEATIVYIITVVLFFIILLTFVIKASNIVKLIIALVLFIPFLLMIKEPYEIISINVNEKDRHDMTKKDFYETFLDKIFNEKQITSPDDLPGDIPEPVVTYVKEVPVDEEEPVIEQTPQEGDINTQIDNNQINNQWWQQ